LINTSQRQFLILLSDSLETVFINKTVWGPEKTKDQLLVLAQALSISPIWSEIGEATLVVRQAPDAALGVLGDFDAAAIARLEFLSRWLREALSSLRYVSYAQVEEDCDRLAAKLLEQFGRDQLRHYRFLAIPRGGFIVLGILSYLLELEQEQLEIPESPDTPIVVVDDCALTGSRFSRFLANHPKRKVIFAHLYSHPDLRTAIESREPQVIGCVSAQNLQDQAPETLGDGYIAWKEQVLARMESDRYWIGQPENICFPWNEPDHNFWNPVTEEVESGWCIVPPHLCLKNRSRLRTHPIAVQVQPEGKAPLKPSARVIFADVGEQVIVGNQETGASFSLTGVAADLWRAIVQQGSLQGAIATLLQHYEVEAAALQADAQKFVNDLLHCGLLEQSDGISSLS
jgi:hypothetical protein